MAPNKNLAKLRAMLKPTVAANPQQPVTQYFGVPGGLDNTEAAEQATAEADEVPVSVQKNTSQIPQNRAPKTTAGPSVEIPKRKKSPARREADQPKKKKAKHSSRSSKGEPLPVDAEFFAKNAEAYKVDPIKAAAELFQHLAEVKAFEMGEIRKAARGELAAVEAKLEETANRLRERERAFEKVKLELDNANTSNATLNAELKEAREGVERLELKVATLESTKDELERSISKLDEKVETLEAQVQSFQRSEGTSNPSAEARIKELQEALEKSQADKAEAAKIALDMQDSGFQNALDQISIVHPEFNLNRDLIKPEFEVDEGKIVVVDPMTEATTVIYPGADDE